MRRSRFGMVMTISSGLMMATLSSLTHVGLRKPIFQSQRLDVFEVAIQIRYDDVSVKMPHGNLLREAELSHGAAQSRRISRGDWRHLPTNRTACRPDGAWPLG